MNNRFQVVEMHKAYGSTDLHYRRGYIYDHGIRFAKSQVFDDYGIEPAIALTHFDLAIEVYSRTNNLLAGSGYLSSDPAKIWWQPTETIQTKGNDPAVTTNGDWIIATWNSNTELRYSVARVP